MAEIKNRLSIAEVVAPYVKLIKAGRSMRGLCPFHKEKTPSFHVSVDRGTYHCFGCGVGGDMFSFIEKIEGVDFKGALAILAEKAGVEVVYDPGAKENASRLERLREAMARAADFYAGRLVKGCEAYDYATKRGLTPETIHAWQLGVAPDDWRVLLEHLAGMGFTTGEIERAGLVKEADGKAGTYYDRFRNRLMFPIKDMASRTVAFTGRILETGSSKLEIGSAKYLNSPETELYHKSEILFGMDRAKDAMRTRGFALLVEGQMDLLHAHQAGFTNAVALSGTAFSERHATLLKRYAENLMLALDGDPAGLTATAKSAHVALREGMRVKAVRLPEGEDPADLISRDGKEFAKRVAEAQPVVEFFLSVIGSREHNPHRLVIAAERIVLPLIRATKSPMERDHFISSTARALSLSPEAVRASVAKAADSVASPAPETVKKSALMRSSRETREDMLKAALLCYPESALARKIQAEYARITEASLSPEPLPDAALFLAEEAFGENPGEDAADELLRAFEEAFIREAYQEKVRMLRRVENIGDPAEIQKAQREVEKLSKRLAALSN